MKWFIPLVIVFVAACSEEPVAMTLDNTVPAFSSHGEPEPDECKSGKSENSAKSEKSAKSDNCSPQDPPV